MSDPMKEMVRRYDRAVCRKGGLDNKSIFGKPYPVDDIPNTPGPPSTWDRKGLLGPTQGAPMLPDEVKAISERRHKTNNPSGLQGTRYKPSALVKNAQVSAHYLPDWDDT